MQDNGQEQYSPTRLEWLAVYLNATCAPRSTDFFDYFFIAGAEQNTLIISLSLKPRAAKEKQKLQAVIDTLKSHIENAIKNIFGWDWVKLEISQKTHPNFTALSEREIALEQARLN